MPSFAVFYSLHSLPSMKFALHVVGTKSSTLPKCLTAGSAHTSPPLILDQHSVLTRGHHVDRRTAREGGNFEGQAATDECQFSHLWGTSPIQH